MNEAVNEYECSSLKIRHLVVVTRPNSLSLAILDKCNAFFECQGILQKYVNPYNTRVNAVGTKAAWPPRVNVYNWLRGGTNAAVSDSVHEYVCIINWVAY